MRWLVKVVGRARSVAVVLVVVMVAAGPGASAQGPDQLVPRDITQADDVIVEGRLCTSDADECVDGESFFGAAGNAELKLKDNIPGIWFDDTDADGEDWEIGIGLESGINEFQFSRSATVTPVRFAADSSDDSLIIDADGVGINTNPDRPLRVEGDPATGSVVKAEHTGLTTELRTVFSLENNGPPGFRLIDNSLGGSNWVFRSSNSGAFSISENDTGLVEFRLAQGGNLTIGGSLTQGSSEANKDDIDPVDAAEVLAGVNALDIATWSYLSAPNTTHIGPMAEDFYATFDLGHGPDGITTVDADGVALAAIQALSAENDELRAATDALGAENVALRSESDAMRAELDALIDRLEALEAAG